MVNMMDTVADLGHAIPQNRERPQTETTAERGDGQLCVDTGVMEHPVRGCFGMSSHSDSAARRPGCQVIARSVHTR